MTVNYLDRAKFLKSAAPADAQPALHKFGSVTRSIKGRDALRSFLVKDGLAHDDVEAAVDSLGKDEAVFSFLLSSAAVDRENDSINQSGWQLDNYRKNPVVLWAHDYAQLPLGVASAVYVAPEGLKAVDRFSTDHELACTVAALIEKRFLNAVSVGFRALKWNWNEDRAFGIDVEESELLEHSVVPVPCHPDALIEARSLGHNIAPVIRWAEQTLVGTKTAAAVFAENAIARTNTSIVVDLGRAKPATKSEPAVNLVEAIELVRASGFTLVDAKSAPAPVELPAPAAAAPAEKAADVPAPTVAAAPAPVAAVVEVPAPVAVAPAAVVDAPLVLDDADKDAIRDEVKGLFQPLFARLQKFTTDQTGRLD